MLEALQLKRWAVFEKKAVLYMVHKREEAIMIYVTGRGADGMWAENKSREKLFSADTSLTEIVEYVHGDMLEQPEASPLPPPRMLMLPPPRTDKESPEKGP